MDKCNIEVIHVIEHYKVEKKGEKIDISPLAEELINLSNPGGEVDISEALEVLDKHKLLNINDWWLETNK